MSAWVGLAVSATRNPTLRRITANRKPIKNPGIQRANKCVAASVPPSSDYAVR